PLTWKSSSICGAPSSSRTMPRLNSEVRTVCIVCLLPARAGGFKPLGIRRLGNARLAIRQLCANRVVVYSGGARLPTSRRCHALALKLAREDARPTEVFKLNHYRA